MNLYELLHGCIWAFFCLCSATFSRPKSFRFKKLDVKIYYLSPPITLGTFSTWHVSNVNFQ